MKTKYAVLAGELRVLCAQLRQTGQTRLPGEEALCARYGYSRQTVRKALAILEQEGLLTRVRGSGTYLSENGQGRTGRIVSITASTDEYLYPQLLRDIEAELSPAGYELRKLSSGNRIVRERKLLQELLQESPSGILLEGAKTALPSPNHDLLEQLDQKGVPIVYLHAPLPVPANAPYILDDNEGGARLLVRHLLEHGHQRIAGIFKSDDRQGIERYRGYLFELCDAGLDIPEDSILWYTTEEREQLLNGKYNWLDRFVYSRLSGCTAVVCYNDEIAYALIRTLTAVGLQVPEQYAVVSFDNSHYCSLSPVPITSLAHERHEMGTAAARALLRLIRGREVHGIRLTWTLRERGSG